MKDIEAERVGEAEKGGGIKSKEGQGGRGERKGRGGKGGGGK